MRQNIVIGPSGWQYRDWVATVYPSCRPKSFHELDYLGEYFSLVEVNRSFQSPIRRESASFWLDRIRNRAGLHLTAKLYHAFTHERTWSDDDVRLVHAGLEPLREAGRLGALVMQFPAAYRWTPESKSHVATLARMFNRYPLVAEFRHASWSQAEPLAHLARLGVGFCNIDQPQLGHAMPPTDIVTSDVAYVRLHGRNYDGWYGLGDTPSPARYDYAYSSRQLAGWAERIAAMARQARRVFVVTNNSARGQSVLNALQLQQMLTASAVAVPQPLIEAYPEAHRLAARRRAPGRVFEVAQPAARRLAS